MNAEAYENLRRKQFGEAKIYALIVLVILSSMGYYFFIQFDIYKLQKESILVQKTQIKSIIEDIGVEDKLFKINETAFENQRKGLNDRLRVVFPEKSDEISFTKDIDKLEIELAEKARLYDGSNFIISSINYSSPVLNETYSVLPFTLSISTSYNRLLEFLKMVESSGSVVHEDKKYRLMSVESINLTLPQDKSDASSAILNFSVRLNAYYQKTNMMSSLDTAS